MINKANFKGKDFVLKSKYGTILFFLALVFSLISLCACNHSSQSKGMPAVAVTTLNVREMPDLYSSRVGILAAGETVVVHKQVDGWAEIEYNGAKGYVMSAYLYQTEDSVAVPNKNKAERKAKNKKEIGRFTQDKKNPTDYYAYTENGFVRIQLPQNIYDLNFDEKVLSFHLRTKWADVLFTYEIVDTSDDVFDTERKINNIIDGFEFKTKDFQSFDDLFYYVRSAMEPGRGNPTVWLKKVGTNGASYIYTGPGENLVSIVLASLYEEAYNYYDGITIHEKVEVRCMDFDTYKNSLDTTMAQNQADEEFQDFAQMLNINVKCVENDAEFEYTNSMCEFIELFKLNKKIDNR